MNRIDKTVVFKLLGEPELRQILRLELNAVQQRVFNSTPDQYHIDYLLSTG